MTRGVMISVLGVRSLIRHGGWLSRDGLESGELCHVFYGLGFSELKRSNGVFTSKPRKIRKTARGVDMS